MSADPKKTAVVITAHPDLRVAPALVLWLLDSGVPRRNILVTRGNDRDQCAAYNLAVEMALTRKVDWCMFADSDVRPYAGTSPIWTAPHDATCAMCECENGLDAWASPSSWHSALWLMRRDKLAKVRPPWFAWRYNPAGSKISACVCAHFAVKVKALGMTIGHAGHAHHWPRGKALPDFISIEDTPCAN